MKRHVVRVMVVVAVLLAVGLAPGVAYADVGNTIVGRLWDSLTSTMKGRLQNGAPLTVQALQRAEKFVLGQTQDVTQVEAVRVIYNAMRVVGMLVLAFCTVISLAGLAESSLLGHSGDFLEWFRRFFWALVMTMGSIHLYGIAIRLFNGLLAVQRDYLAKHYTGEQDPSALFTSFLPHLGLVDGHLTLVFALVALVVLLVLWFLLGGVRTAELAISVIIAPLVWPLYLLPAFEDVPRTALRRFLALNAVLLLVVAMLHVAVRWVTAGGIATTVWNLVPGLSMLVLTVFMPTMLKGLLGQGHTGAGGLMTAVSMLAGLKGLPLVGGAASVAAARPPAAPVVPSAFAGPSPYPVVPIQTAGSIPMQRGNSVPPYGGEVRVEYPAGLPGGPAAAPLGLPPSCEAGASGPYLIEMGRSNQDSEMWDLVQDIRPWRSRPGSEDTP